MDKKVRIDNPGVNVKTFIFEFTDKSGTRKLTEYTGPGALYKSISDIEKLMEKTGKIPGTKFKTKNVKIISIKEK